MIGGCGVTWLTVWAAWNRGRLEFDRSEGTSGHSSFGVRKHPTGKIEHSYRGKRLSEKANACLCVVRSGFADRAQNQNRQVGRPAAQLADECRPAHSRKVMAGDHEAQIVSELLLLDQAKRVGGVGNTANVAEALLQGREDKGRLERIVVHEEDACH